MVDPEAYRRRRQQFEAWLANAKNPTLIEKYKTAITMTARAAETFEKLVDVKEKEWQEYRRESDAIFSSIEKEAANLTRQVDALVERLRNETDSSKRVHLEIESGSLRMSLFTAECRNISFQISSALRDREVQKLKALTEVLFRDVFAPDETEFSKKAAVSAIEFAVGVTPVGPIYDLVKKLSELDRWETQQGQGADKHLTYVDDYCEAVARWCGAADEAIRSWSERFPSS